MPTDAMFDLMKEASRGDDVYGVSSRRELFTFFSLLLSNKLTQIRIVNALRSSRKTMLRMNYKIELLN